MGWISGEDLGADVADTGATLTIPGGSNRYLVLVIAGGFNGDANGVHPATLSLGGQTLNRQTTIADASDDTSISFYVANEATIAAMSGSSLSSWASGSISSGVALYYDDIDQTAGVVTTDASATGLDPEPITLSSISSGDLCIVGGVERGGRTITAASTTSRTTSTSGGTNVDCALFTFERTASGTSETINLDVVQTDRACGAGIALTPTAGGGNTGETHRIYEFAVG